MEDSKKEEIKEKIDREWNINIIPSLSKYIEIPNVSPAFDPEWGTNGLIDDAVKLIRDWVCDQKINGLHSEIIKLDNTTPLLICELPPISDSKQSILFYGHLDKQPPQTDQWSHGLHPYKPILKDNYLYGRGSADDGYSVYMTITIWKLLEEYNIPHGRFVLIAESSEESSSIDLPKYIGNDNVLKIINNPDLIICLDAGCDDYEKMYLTSSLRGCMTLDLNVNTLKKPIHSSNAGVVPEPFNVLREVIGKLIDDQGNFIKELPDQDDKLLIEKYKQKPIKNQASIHYPLLDEKINEYDLDQDQIIMRRIWQPQLTLIGLDGFPNTARAGNIICPNLTARFSMRVPPHCSTQKVYSFIKKILEEDLPKCSDVKLNLIRSSEGWLMKYDDTLMNAISNSTNNNWSFRGAGGSIPFMNIIAKKFPLANFIVTGVLGPRSNAHGPDECLNIDYAKKLTNWLFQLISII